MSVYEWAFAILFAMFLSFFSADWVLDSTKKNVLRLYERALVGQNQKEGLLYERAFSSYEVMPLFSALGVEDFSSKRKIPFELYGQPVRGEGHIELEGYDIDGMSVDALWNPKKYNLEGVYSKPLHVRGYFKADKPRARLLVSYPGTPLQSK